MTLVWARVDCKLVHGQISTAWVPHLKAETVIVADEDTAADAWAQKIMRLGLPAEISLIRFTPPRGLPGLLTGAEMADKRILLIFKSLAGALEAAEAGLEFTALNLGNQLDQDRGAEKVRLAETFFAGREELEALARLQRRGLKVSLQSVPSSKPVTWKP